MQDPSESLAVVGRYISENYNGAALHPIDFIDISTGQLVAEVKDPNITTISPVNKLHPREDVLASGSSRLWHCSLIFSYSYVGWSKTLYAGLSFSVLSSWLSFEFCVGLVSLSGHFTFGGRRIILSLWNRRKNESCLFVLVNGRSACGVVNLGMKAMIPMMTHSVAKARIQSLENQHIKQN